MAPLPDGQHLERREEAANRSSWAVIIGWTLRRIEHATGVRPETASAYLKAAGLAATNYSLLGRLSTMRWRLKRGPTTPANRSGSRTGAP